MLVIDNFLDEGDPLLSEMRNDMHWQSALCYSFIDRETEAVSHWQKMVRRIWSIVSSIEDVPEDYAGVEYWSNIMSMDGPRQDLPWHFDKDEHLFSKGDGKLVRPYIGSVYYAHTEIPEEGYLEIRRGNNENDVERIQPVPNRLIIFDSGTVHRVTPITSGIRRCFATNVWINKPCEENFV